MTRSPRQSARLGPGAARGPVAVPGVAASRAAPWPIHAGSCEGLDTAVRGLGLLVVAACAACVEGEPVVLVRGAVLSTDVGEAQPIDVHALGDDGAIVARAPLSEAGEWVLALGVGGPWRLVVGTADAREDAVVRDGATLSLLELEVCGAAAPQVLAPFRARSLACVDTAACVAARELERECNNGERCLTERAALSACEQRVEAICGPVRQLAADCLAQQPMADCTAELEASAGCRPPDACAAELEAYVSRCQVCETATAESTRACGGTCAPVGLAVYSDGGAAKLRLGCAEGT